MFLAVLMTAVSQSLRGPDCVPVGSNGWFYVDCKNATSTALLELQITDDS